MNDFKTALFIAYKSIIKGSKSTVALMIFILSLTFFNMLFISGVLSGLNDSEITLLINLMSSHIAVSPQEKPVLKQYIPDQHDVRAQIEAIPGVIATTRHYNLAGSLAFDKDKNGVYKNVSGPFIGVDPTEDKKVFTMSSLLIRGSNLSDDDTDQIVLSSALAGGYGAPAPNDLGGVKVGDKVRVTFSNGIIRTYTVKGIYNDIMGIFETFITAKEAESVLSIYDNASQIFVKTDLSSASISDYQHKIQSIEPNLKIQTYSDLIASFASFLQALNLISFVVSAISVLVAAFTIYVLIYVNAINKRRQIGILKAIGIKKRIIISAYIIQSLFYTICAITIGLVGVLGILKPLLDIYKIPIIEGLMYLVLFYSPLRVVLSVIAFIVAGLLGGFIPSRIVAKEDILKAIWG